MQCSPLPYSCKSLVVVQNMRVDFQFDKAAFTFNALPFKLPYPVPFKLLGDETKVYDSPGLFGCLMQICFKRAHSFNVDAFDVTFQRLLHSACNWHHMACPDNDVANGTH